MCYRDHTVEVTRGQVSLHWVTTGKLINYWQQVYRWEQLLRPQTMTHIPEPTNNWIYGIYIYIYLIHNRYRNARNLTWIHSHIVVYACVIIEWPGYTCYLVPGSPGKINIFTEHIFVCLAVSMSYQEAPVLGCCSSSPSWLNIYRTVYIYIYIYMSTANQFNWYNN